MLDCESIDIVDKDNNIIRESDVATAHAEGLRHRIAGVFVFDTDETLYLQNGLPALEREHVEIVLAMLYCKY